MTLMDLTLEISEELNFSNCVSNVFQELLLDSLDQVEMMLMRCLIQMMMLMMMKNE